MANDLIPFLISRESEPHMPVLGSFQTPAPICDLKGGIPLMLVIGKVNLRLICEGWPNTILVAARIPDRICRHELRGFEN